MREDLASIMILVDGSGSMSAIKQGVIEGINGFVTEQKGLPGHALFSMAQFDSGYSNELRYNTLYDFVDIDKAQPLTDYSYIPGGGTPLLDATAKAVRDLGSKLASIPEASRPSKVILVIVTDGQENTSQDTKKEQVQAMLKHQQDVYNWQVVYLGANQDSFAEAGQMGIMRSATANYAYTSQGLNHAVMSTSASVGSYRGGHSLSVDLTDLQKEDDLESK